VDEVRTVFPSFLTEKLQLNDERADLWRASSTVVREGFRDGPVILFNLTQQGEGDTLGFSSFSGNIIGSKGYETTTSLRIWCCRFNVNNTF